MQLPKEFTDYTSHLFGEERWNRFLAAMQEPAPVSIRYNPFKGGYTDNMAELFGDHTPVPWCDNAYWLAQRPPFTSDPHLHAGKYYVQEAASMFLDTVIRQHVNTPVCMLDLCAAPGGKSTLARAALPPTSTLYANEPDRRRASILYENIIKQGHPDVIVTNNYPRHYARAGQMFDVILADVPCSGEGMFRRDPKTIEEWSVANVQRCAALQRDIITEIWDCLQPGGILIYSTCTFNTHENEENVMYICSELGASLIPADIGGDYGITGSLHPALNGPVYRFIPGTTRTEGLFMAVLRKHGQMPLHATKNTHCLPATKLNVLNGCSKALPADKDRRRQKGKEEKARAEAKPSAPQHAEALSISLDRSKYPMHEVTLKDALRYLHREAMTLPPETPKGHVIITYDNMPLGFVKNIGNRANNLYPKEWAIRKAVD